MNINNAYVSYGKYSLDYDTRDSAMTIACGKAYISAKLSGSVLSDYDTCEISYKLENEGICKTVTYKKSDKTLCLILRASAKGIRVENNGDIEIDGTFDFADTDSLASMRVNKLSPNFNCSLGHAVSPSDNAIFCKDTDSAALIESKEPLLGFSYDKNKYTLCGKADFTFSVMEDIYSKNFNIPYGKINKNATFGSLPPVGWMSWYAVKFDASEDTVLENARFQSEHLKDFGANAIWVDWEWYHKGFYKVSDWVHSPYYEKEPRKDGVDTFNPDKAKYPNGLKYVSDKVKELGLIPSLWIGFTHETWETDYIKKHPEIVITAEPTWVGIYFYDITHPTYLNDYLPKALAQVKQWGYDAIKFDTLPICMEMTERYHERLYDKSLTTYEAYRNMISKTREILGEDMYMLSCSGDNRCDILWGADIFDGARIGLDIFKWNEFIANCIKRTMEFYPLHNIMLLNDPDNVVIREEFNTMNQAISRAVFVSMLGMPVTLGDNLPELSADRLNILKRVIPSLDITTKDMEATVADTDILITNLNVSKKWENYNVVSVFNTTEEDRTYTLNLKEDADVRDGKYHIYDFWHDEYLGCVSGDIDLELGACETRVLSIRADKGIPQIISTNRHITQGAMEIEDTYIKDGVMYIKSSLVKGDLYTIAVCLSDGYKISDAGIFDVQIKESIAYLTFTPDKTGEFEFEIKFNN